MKLPLLLHCKPKLVTGPIVLLHKGNWIIEARNLVDSEINLNLDNPSLSSDEIEWLPVYNDKLIEITEDTKVQLKVIKAGTESELTVYIRKLK